MVPELAIRENCHYLEFHEEEFISPSLIIAEKLSFVASKSTPA